MKRPRAPLPEYPEPWNELFKFANDAFIRTNKETIFNTKEHQDALKAAYPGFVQQVETELYNELMGSEAFRKEVETGLVKEMMDAKRKAADAHINQKNVGGFNTIPVVVAAATKPIDFFIDLSRDL